jgi:iron complex outermembrane receptor protein
MRVSICFQRYFYVLAMCFSVAITVFSQHQIQGTVKDEITIQNVTGAHIYLAELKLNLQVDSSGKFVINNVKKGTYLIEIGAAGYTNLVQSIALVGDTSITFFIKQAVTEMEEVVITAVSRSTELRKSPIIIKPVDMATLNQSSATNLIDALKNVPGVSQITTGAGISKPTIRGLGYNRVISLSNGIRQEGQQWGDEHGVEIDEYSVDRIEVVKGPGSLMYGSDGIAGVLNFIAAKAPVEGEVKSQWTSNYQRNNQLIANSISNAGNKNGFQWQGRVTSKLASNYQNKYDGKVANSGFQEYDGNVFLGIHKSWGYSHLTLSSFNNTINMVEGDRDSLGHFLSRTSGYAIGFPHQSVQHTRVLSNSYFNLKKGALHLDLGYQQNKRKEFGDAAHPSDIALFFDLTTLNYNLRYNIKEKKGWETSIGISGMEQTNVNRGLEVLIPAYSLTDVGGFLFTQKTIATNLVFATGIRYDYRFLTAQNLSRLFDSYAGSIGLSYQLKKKNTIKLNLSRGFRAPNIAELTSNGKHEGSLRYEYGNENLSPEISHQLDLAYFVNKEHFTLEITPFTNFISNYIYTKKLTSFKGGDSIPDPSDPVAAYRFTQGNATLFGGECYMDFHPHPLDWLHVANSFSFVQAIQKNQPDSLKYLPFIPAPKYRGELRAQFKEVNKHVASFYAKVAIDCYFTQNHYFKAYATETSTPSYNLLSAGIGGVIQTKTNPSFLSVYVSAENLTDVAYQSHLSRLKYAPVNTATGRVGVYNMGRNFSVKLVFTI